MRQKIKYFIVFFIAWVSLCLGVVNFLILDNITTPIVIRQEYPVVVEVTPIASPSASVTPSNIMLDVSSTNSAN